ncbi:protein-cysteine n-palmitoyltransferase hhat [Plakobranchus ocellatus]|uniref:Protein-cysteine n-palmitoyltransferase hhat n=1 Tax=Plakobranchus ocellatus TaxID=259542 RepID=A0AAV3YH06_9GAST|nr:protein-cysteine n-palmitoyltransferase hhat [Plakobranchus ocellatus]
MFTFQEIMLQDILPKWERWAYWVIEIYGIVYSWWRVFVEGEALKNRNLHNKLHKNWSFLDRPYDSTDYLWSQWMINLKFHLILCLIHIATSQICRLMRFSVAMRQCGLVLCDLGCLCMVFGYRAIVFCLLKTLLVYLISQLGSVAGIWIVLGGEIIVCHIPEVRSLLSGHSRTVEFEPALAFLNIKLISFGVDNAQLIRKNFQNKICVSSETTLNEKKITSTDDITQPNETPLTGNTKSSALKKLSFWALGGVGHLVGQFFMIKYVVFYGFGGQLGRFDGVNPYPEPRCVSWVYSYTDMWKYFDTGLYKFIKTYIYVPLGGSRHGLIRQLAASGVAFLFLYVWHGGTLDLFIWCFGNYLVCSIEQIGVAVERSLLGQRLVSAVGPVMQLRIKCLLLVFAHKASCFQAFFLVLYLDDAREMFENIVLKSSWLQLGTMVGIFYAGIHNAKFLDCKLSKHYKKLG